MKIAKRKKKVLIEDKINKLCRIDYLTARKWWSKAWNEPKFRGYCGFGNHAYPEVFTEKKIPQLSESPDRRRMRASSDPQAYSLWPVWTIEWIRAMEQKKEKKIQVIGRINWGPMKCIFQEKLEEWI